MLKVGTPQLLRTSTLGLGFGVLAPRNVCIIALLGFVFLAFGPVAYLHLLTLKVQLVLRAWGLGFGISGPRPSVASFFETPISVPGPEMGFRDEGWRLYTIEWATYRLKG